MEAFFYFIDNTDREVSLTIQHKDETDPNVCCIIADFSPKDNRESVGVEFSVDSVEQLDDMISALQFIRNRGFKKNIN